MATCCVQVRTTATDLVLLLRPIKPCLLGLFTSLIVSAFLASFLLISFLLFIQPRLTPLGHTCEVLNKHKAVIELVL